MRNRHSHDFRDTHHWFPRCRRIKGTDDYVSWLWRSRHVWIHRIFGNLTIREIIELLERVERRYCQGGRQ